MAIIQVNLTDTINGFRLKTNTLATQVGDLSILDTSGGDSSVVSGINSLDSDMGRQADLNYRESSDSTFLTLVDAINRIVDSDGNIDSAMIPHIALDSDSVLNHMIADDQVDSSHILDSSITTQMLQQDAVEGDNIDDSAIQGYHFDAMTVLKIFASNGTELRKIYGPARFDNDSANTFRTNPWV
tara:strand:- start:202 stop:756 length:555 start_codon:yes stop_codon:yes gene_type:complete